MLTIKNMPNILHECTEADKTLLFIIGRPKDINVVVYHKDDSVLGLNVYWRLQDGSRCPISLIERTLAIGAIRAANTQLYFIVAFPKLKFSITNNKAYRNGKEILYVFLGRANGFFSVRPSSILIVYKKGESEYIKT